MKIDQNRSGSPEQTREIPVTSVLFFIFFFWFFYCRYGNLLFMAQNYDLFLWDGSFIFNYCRTVAGPLRCLSSFLLQFFYFPLLGAVFLSALLVLLQRMIKSVFHLNGSGEFFSWLPCCLLALLVTRMKYYFFDWADTAFLFSITYGLFAVFLMVVIYLKINSKRKRAYFLSAVSLLTWPLLGFFTLEAVIICLLLEFGNCQKKDLLLSVGLPLIIALFSPIIWFPLNSLEIPFSRIWFAGLLEESAVDKDLETFRSFYFILTVTIFLPLLLAAFRAIFPQSVNNTFNPDSSSDVQLKPTLKPVSKTSSKTKNERPRSDRKKSKTLVKSVKSINEKKRSQSKSITPAQKTIAENFSKSQISSSNTTKEPKKNSGVQKTVNLRSLTILFLLCVMTTIFSYDSPNYKALLKLGPALQKEDWNQVLKISESVADPSDPVLMFRLLALDKNDLLADQIFEKAPVINEISDLMKMLADGFYGDRLLYHFGQVNHAARAAMNNWTIRRQRSAWDLETLALCAVTCKEFDLADRYLTLLEKTLFHRANARLLREFVQLENRSLRKENSQNEKMSRVLLDSLSKSQKLSENENPSKTSEQTELGKIPKLSKFEESLKILACSIEKIRSEIPPRDSFGPFVHPDSIIFYEMMTQDFSNSPEKLQYRQLTFLLLLKRADLFLEKCALYAKTLNLQNQKNTERIRIPRAIQEGLLYYLKYRASTDSKYRANTDSLNSSITSSENAISQNTTTSKDPAETGNRLIKSIRKEDFSFHPEIEKRFEKFCALVDLLEGKETAAASSSIGDPSLIIDEITTSFSRTFWFYERFLPSVEPYWKKQLETQKKARTVNAPGEAH